MTPDLINALFTILGTIIIALNIHKVMGDKLVRGVHWYMGGFFCLWGIWNLFYYQHLDQWLSFTAGILMVTMNLIYTALLIHYTWKEQQRDALPKLLIGYTPTVYEGENVFPFREDNDVGC